MFWGITIDDGKHYTQTVEESFHISMAALETKDTSEGENCYVCVMVKHEKAEFLICTLEHGKHLQQPLNLTFTEGEEVTFFIEGKGIVHLTGSLIPEDKEEAFPDIDDAELSTGSTSESSATGSSEEGNSDGGEEGEESGEELPTLRELVANHMNGGVDKDQDDSEEGDEWRPGKRKRISTKQHSETPSSKLRKSKRRKVQTPEDAEIDDDDDEESDSDDEDYQPEKEEEEEEDEESDAVKVDREDESDEDDDEDVEMGGDESVEMDSDDDEEDVFKEEDSDEEEDGDDDDTDEEEDEGKVTTTSDTSDVQKGASSEDGDTVEKKKRKKTKKAKPRKESGDTESSAVETPKKHVTTAKSTKTKKPVKKKLKGGIVIEDLQEGGGKLAKLNKMLSVYYSGKLAKNNKKFDSCLEGKPFTFRLGKGEVIQGWDIGFQGMKVGGKRRITIPPQFGYGKQKMGDIPPHSQLVFEVELKAVS